MPLGVAVFAHDITQSVRPLAERLYDVRHWSEFDRGGYFAAMEVPDLLAEDVRAFFTLITREAPTGGSGPDAHHGEVAGRAVTSPGDDQEGDQAEDG